MECPDCKVKTKRVKRKEEYEIGKIPYIVNVILHVCPKCNTELVTEASHDKYAKDMVLIKRKAEEYAKRNVH